MASAESPFGYEFGEWLLVAVGNRYGDLVEEDAVALDDMDFREVDYV